MEIMVVNTAVAHNSKEGKTHQLPSVIQTSKMMGMQLLNAHLVELVRQDIVDPDEAYLKAVDKSDIMAKIRAAGFKVNTEL